jgi:hypothetical protein
MKTLVRENAINQLKGNRPCENSKPVVDKFFWYLDCYCAEMKHSEQDVLLNDEHYDLVWNLFSNIVLKEKVA